MKSGEKRKGYISVSDAVLIVLALGLGGAGGARSIINIAKRQLRNHGKRYGKDIAKLDEKRFRVVLARLKSANLISPKERGVWSVTKKGKATAQVAIRHIKYKKTKTRLDSAKVVIIFDIPEEIRKKRRYLRTELRALEFEPLQKSVWIGHGPLPKAFIEYVRDLRILKFVQIFTIKEGGTIGS